ncbi:J domain-containing protein [Salinarimonas sp. NSM]|uniref:J domain-containing protein n=1 Tax=Salinarimonas sp. NSM TaxID=3458003 RepID=UPI004035D0D6
MTEAYPLSWPEGWPRTPIGRRMDGRAKFVRHDRKAQAGKTAYDWTFGESRDALMGELSKHGARGIVISTNRQLRRDGLPLASGRIPEDDGVAIYFTRAGRPLAMACDRFLRAEHNMRSLTLALEAMRALERHGGGVMMERAYAGFAALPSPGAARPWHVVLGVSPVASVDEIRAAHRRLIKEHHSDHGGSDDRAAEINAARDAGVRERG